MNSCYACNCDVFYEIDGKVTDLPSMKIFKCSSCNLIFLENFDHIHDNFYSNGEMNIDNRYSIDSNCLDIKFWRDSTFEDDSRRFNFLKRQSNIKNKSILDFGSGAGGFLKLCSKEAQNVSGVEPNKTISSVYNQDKIRQYFSINEVENFEKFDIVTAFHVIEHLKDPISYLKKIKRVLSKNGKIYLEFPNSDDALISYYKNKDFCNFTFWSCHLMLFNEDNIELIANKAELNVKNRWQVQRYPISNHLYWLSNGKPGGHNIFNEFKSKDLEEAYYKVLSKNKICDTVIVELEVFNENIC